MGMDHKEPYFGSVRFFKNLILLFVIAVISILAFFDIKLKIKSDRQEELLSEYREKYLRGEEELENSADTYSAAEGTEDLSYQSLYPDFYVERPEETTDGIGNVYLTFDDGPSSNTDRILKVLEEKGIKATFFVVTQGDERDIEEIKKIARRGHTVGMHSFSHDYSKIYTSVEEFLRDYYRLFTVLRDQAGITPDIFRFPGGSINRYDQGIYQEIIAEMLRRGFVFYDWNLSAEDGYSAPLSKGRVLENILPYSPGKKRGIVLMHDADHCAGTVRALPELIDGLREQGFSLLPLDSSVRPVIFEYKS